MYRSGAADEGIRLAVAFKKMTADRTLDMVGRYQDRLNREYERAIRGLDRVRAERKARETAAAALPAEEIRQNEPEPLKTPVAETEVLKLTLFRIYIFFLFNTNFPEPLAKSRSACTMQSAGKISG
jgi:hypothetical protein